MPQVIIGQATKPTGAAPASVDVNLGTTPNVIFFSTSSDSNSSVTQGYIAWGCAVRRPSGAEEATIATSASDGSPSSARYNDNTKCISKVTSGTTFFLADCTFLFANHSGETIDGFRLTFTTNDATAELINYMALCGDDITDAQITTVDITTGGPNTYSVGLDFWPDCALFFTDGQNTLANRADDGGAWNLGYWVAEQNSQQNAVGIGIDTSGADYIGLAQTTTGTSTGMSNTDNTAAFNLAASVALDTSTPGVTITELIGSVTAHKLYVLAIQGGKWGTVRLAGPAGAGNQSNTSIGFLPRGLLGQWTVSSSNATSGDKSLSIGFTDMTNYAGNARTVQTRITVSGDNTARATYTSVWMRMISNVPATVADVTIVSTDATGYTANFTAASSGRQAHVLAVGDGPIYDYDEGW